MRSSESKSSFPWLFFVLAFLIAWLFWLPGILATQQVIALPVPWPPLFGLGVFGPFFSAIIVTLREGGRPGLRAWFKQIFNFRIALKWLPIIFLLPAGLTLAGMLLDVWLFDGTFPEPAFLQNPLLIASTFLLMLVMGGGQEEFGWRGYALDRLQGRWNALVASLVLGLIWGLWHTPLFFVEWTGEYYMPWYTFILLGPGMSVFFTWVYNSTGRNTVAAWLLHASVNAALDLLAVLVLQRGVSQSAFLLVLVAYNLLALALVWRYGPATLAAGTDGMPQVDRGTPSALG